MAVELNQRVQRVFNALATRRIVFAARNPISTAMLDG
jgi:hypothetical protein